MYSVKFKNCKTIYPLRLVRPLVKKKIDNKAQLSEVINDISSNNFIITQFIADNLKRATAKECKNHASWFPCEYCYGKGVKIEITTNSKAKKQLMEQMKLVQEKMAEYENVHPPPESRSNYRNLMLLQEKLKKSLNALQSKSNIRWPYSTMKSEHRSRRSIIETVEKLENNENLAIDEARGIVGRSLFLDLEYFDFVYDIPAEYLHSSCLGVVKRLTILTFNVGENRPRVTTRKLTPPEKFNTLMLRVKVHKEFPRRARKLDVSIFKGQEYRNLALFFFPLIIACLESEDQEITLWLNLAYMMRSSVIPSNEFASHDINTINECCDIFYKLFEQLFGIDNTFYNLHVFISHLMEIRTHGPLTETSAFKFESFYGEMRRAFVSGTVSPLKQIMKNVLLARTIRKHVCENNIFISNYETNMESNNMIYCFVRDEYKIYEIADINENIVTCHKIGQYPAKFNQTPNLMWSKVGVFKKGGKCSTPTEINISDISGKVLKVDKYLLTCPINVLNEK